MCILGLCNQTQTHVKKLNFVALISCLMFGDVFVELPKIFLGLRENFINVLDGNFSNSSISIYIYIYIAEN